jgi:chaperone modulatory protein CbpM
MNFVSKTQICNLTGLDEHLLQLFIEREWIAPVEPSSFDSEDVARVHLILELERDFGANEAAIPIILHLVDQLHYYHRRLNQVTSDPSQ